MTAVCTRLHFGRFRSKHEIRLVSWNRSELDILRLKT